MVWVQFTWHIHYGMGTIYMAHTLWYGYNLHGTYTTVWVQFTWHIHYGMGTIYMAHTLWYGYNLQPVYLCYTAGQCRKFQSCSGKLAVGLVLWIMCLS